MKENKLINKFADEKQKDHLAKEQPKKRHKRYVQKEPVISKVAEIDFSGTYSYANYLRWEFEGRLELIKGKIFEMAAPAPFHQLVSGRLAGELYFFLKRWRCKVYPAPFDVRFPDASKRYGAIYTVLQPDISVVCEQAKIDGRGCMGAPDIVVEILSPGNQKKELEHKFTVYETYGVREYWIVDPEKRYLLKYIRNAEGIFRTGKLYDGGTEFVSDVLPGFKLNVSDLFED